MKKNDLQQLLNSYYQKNNMDHCVLQIFLDVTNLSEVNFADFEEFIDEGFPDCKLTLQEKKILQNNAASDNDSFEYYIYRKQMQTEARKSFQPKQRLTGDKGSYSLYAQPNDKLHNGLPIRENENGKKLYVTLGEGNDAKEVQVQRVTNAKKTAERKRQQLAHNPPPLTKPSANLKTSAAEDKSFNCDNNSKSITEALLILQKNPPVTISEPNPDDIDSLNVMLKQLKRSYPYLFTKDNPNPHGSNDMTSQTTNGLFSPKPTSLAASQTPETPLAKKSKT